MRATPAVTASCRPLVVVVVILPAEPQGLAAVLVVRSVFKVVFVRALLSFEIKAIDVDAVIVEVFILTGQTVTLTK